MIKENLKLIDSLIIIIVFVSGLTLGHYFYPKVNTQIKVAPTPTQRVIVIKGEDKIQTIIKYIPKEVNPQTGEKEKTDVDLKINKPEINVTLNDQPYIIVPNFNESQKFEDGKLVFNQQSNISLDIQLPKPERKIELGGYVSLDSFGATLLIPNKNTVGTNIIMIGPHYNLKGFDLIYSFTE